jgi:hypothetical protein
LSEVEQLQHVADDLLPFGFADFVGHGEEIQEFPTFMPSATPKLSGM